MGETDGGKHTKGGGSQQGNNPPADPPPLKPLIIELRRVEDLKR